MFGSLTSAKRQRVNTLQLIHSLAIRASILNGFLQHDAVQLSSPVFHPQVNAATTLLRRTAHALPTERSGFGNDLRRSDFGRISNTIPASSDRVATHSPGITQRH